GVRHVLATFAVGSLRMTIPPLALVAVDQFLDFTQGRAHTFFAGEHNGFAHTDMTNPLCSGLRAGLLQLAAQRGLNVIPTGVYACTNGPRLETAAEVRMLAQLGGDVVGMTGVPEMPLAREAGLHYAGVAYVINYGAGL
ncbi:MAG: S-methyl-5'-thioadenosine phosphorylase, partial [Chloroflexi bacterium]